MSTTIARRTLFTTGAVALAGFGASPWLPAPAAQRRPAQDDPVLEHVGREFARLHRAAKSGGFRAEHLQSIASNLRLMATASGPALDSLVKQALTRRDFDEHRHHLDPNRVRGEVRQRFGMDVSGEAPPAPLQPEVEKRVRARLVKEGISPSLLALAAQLEQQAGKLAKLGDLPAGPRPVQIGDCSLLGALSQAYSALCTYAMFAGPLQGQFYASCAVAYAAWTAAWWATFYSGTVC